MNEEGQEVLVNLASGMKVTYRKIIHLAWLRKKAGLDKL